MLYRGDSVVRRVARVRSKLRSRAGGRPRLSVFRSERHVYAQVIDDAVGKTLASASSAEKSLKSSGLSGDFAVEKMVGKLIAERAAAQSVSEVVFDRGRFAFHGRVKAVAESAREGGLVF
ncbi:50S ribosomal protein L18 [Candidatus Hydrogenosomobacter endosymbioticus]|uniref:Large ribosomal subunit protein uL18 n=1 Tax=Candidatus Hydrogenosomobacter endosymbioticus TaxID=2558174 RepID=A0ABM7V8D0_9PROT|nr:50S ribosomal protein L18 [Candidatus Hydrogenosomobacter endosymbioticus]BDB95998.1 50S ribosomal protein L18 [Candidatus Hydrogenosomobacter endosymbioticus]